MSSYIIIAGFIILFILIIILLIKNFKNDNKNNSNNIYNTQASGNINHLLNEISRKYDNIIDNTNNYSKESVEKLNSVKDSLVTQMNSIKDVLIKETNSIKKDVDEKLLDNLKTFMDKIAIINQDIGSIKSLSSSIMDLSRSLNNVKTKGVKVEKFLENIISNILVPDQYEKDFNVGKGKVEFAIKIPTDSNDFVYLPIDAKFPQEAMNKINSSDDNKIKEGKNELTSFIKKQAGDIKKYIDVPRTTNYAIMFLPTEDILIEAINLNIDVSEYGVILASPSTLFVIINNIKESYIQLKIKKEYLSVIKQIANIKKEYDKYIENINKIEKDANNIISNISDIKGIRLNKLLKTLDVSEYKEMEEENEITKTTL